MGTWKIEIEGHGIHHNKRADDANVMTAMFATFLRAAGHDVSAARFVLTNADGEPVGGGTDDVLTSGYIDARGAAGR